MRLPWYATLWRSLWLVPLLAVAAVALVVIACGWGPGAARGVWRDLT